MERRLGKGLGSLLSGAQPETGAAEVEVDQLSPNPYQPRKQFDAQALDDLRQSIARHGVLQPIVVRRAGQRYEIISGERRWRASRAAGLQTIPVVVRDRVSDQQMLELALVENLQRQDLNPIERALGFKAMVDQLALTQDQVAERVGLKRSTVANHLRLLELPRKVQEAVAADLLQMGHAKALLGLVEERAILALMEQTVRKGLSVREVEERVRSDSAGQTDRAAKRAATGRPPSWVQTLERRLSDALGTRVAIRNSDGYVGSIAIQYFSRDELERLIERLAPADRV
jgi:ParB family chromosome partitioning protein